jgi:predicted phosphodiesterase
VLIAFLSDIHSNQPALEAVLGDLAALEPDRVYCLGDLVGYGPHPQACVDTVRDLGWPVLLGDHEAAILDPNVAWRFNSIARDAIIFTGHALNMETREWLATFPDELVDADLGLHLVHGSPFGKEKWLRYIQNEEEAANAFSAARQPVLFYGHTHLGRGRSDPTPDGAAVHAGARPQGAD